jgi:hypothetical protein
LVACSAGCEREQARLERTIREEMKTKLSVEVASFDLKKQPDGGYAGTATAANGETYDVTATPPRDGRTEWLAVPGRATLERQIREGIEAQTKAKLKSLDLAPQSPGVYAGTAVLESGDRLKITTYMEGTMVMWKGEPLPE